MEKDNPNKPDEIYSFHVEPTESALPTTFEVNAVQIEAKPETTSPNPTLNTYETFAEKRAMKFYEANKGKTGVPKSELVFPNGTNAASQSQYIQILAEKNLVSITHIQKGRGRKNIYNFK